MANIRTIYGKSYDLDNPQDAAEVLRIQKQAQLKTVQKALSPNQIINSKKRMEAANLLAQNQAMENANAGVMTVAPTVEGLLRPARETRENRLGLINFGKNDNRPKKINTNAGGLLNLPLPPNSNLQLNQQTQNLLNNQVDQSSTQSQPVQSAQPQPKKTLGQRASGLFDRASNAYMGAAPILAVAQEFQKAGALRPIGEPMQGDPYGKMMEIQQGRQQSENLAQLRQQYPQFANLSDKNFEQVITNLASDGKLNVGNQLQQTEEQRDANQLRNIKNSMQTGDADAALSYGAFDRLAGGISSISGKFGLPIKKYQTANTATEGFIRDAMNASRANFDGRQTNLLFEFIKEEMPEPNMNEQQALERTKTVYRRFDDAITGYEQLLDDPNSNLTTSQRGNISKALKLYEGVRDRSLVRIKSIEDVISSSKLEKAAGDSVYEAPDVNDTNLDTSEINEWNNSLSIREQIQ